MNARLYVCMCMNVDALFVCRNIYSGKQSHIIAGYFKHVLHNGKSFWLVFHWATTRLYAIMKDEGKK